jgi:hypothetical protein
MALVIYSGLKIANIKRAFAAYIITRMYSLLNDSGTKEARHSGISLVGPGGASWRTNQSEASWYSPRPVCGVRTRWLWGWIQRVEIPRIITDCRLLVILNDAALWNANAEIWACVLTCLWSTFLSYNIIRYCHCQLSWRCAWRVCKMELHRDARLIFKKIITWSFASAHFTRRGKTYFTRRGKTNMPRHKYHDAQRHASSQVIALPIAKRKIRNTYNKNTPNGGRVYRERGVPLPFFSSGVEWVSEKSPPHVP